MELIADDGFPTDRLDPELPTGVVLCGMGGPDGPDAVAPFLRNLFADPLVLPLPGWLARPVGRFIVHRRLSAVKRRYAAIDPRGASPQIDWTRRQAAALLSRFEKASLTITTACAMRYWHPFPKDTVAALLETGIRQFVVLPLYPHYASATSGSVLREVHQTLRRACPEAPSHFLSGWHRQPGYIEALRRRTCDALLPWAREDENPRRCALLFSAHSLPERFVRAGDPYLRQCNDTVADVVARLTVDDDAQDRWLSEVRGTSIPRLAFQSRVGPVRWIGPDLVDEVRRVAADGCRRLAVVPISFSCEHIETLHELDIELAQTAADCGIDEFRRAPALNDDAAWLDSLAAHVTHRAFGSALAGS